MTKLSLHDHFLYDFGRTEDGGVLSGRQEEPNPHPPTQRDGVCVSGLRLLRGLSRRQGIGFSPAPVFLFRRRRRRMMGESRLGLRVREEEDWGGKVSPPVGIFFGYAYCLHP